MREVTRATEVKARAPWSTASRLSQRLGKVLEIRQASMTIILVLIVLSLSLATDRFLTVTNLINVARQVSIISVVAIGMTMVIISAGIDLSVGGIVAVAGSFSAAVMATTGNVPLAIAVGLLTGTALGAVNGLFIAYFNLAAFIVTLATFSLTRSANLAFTHGWPLSVTTEAYNFIGQGYLGPVPVPVVIMFVLYLVGTVTMQNTRFGRYVYALGDNEEAVRLAGINVSTYRLAIYTLTGTLCGLGGIMLTARLGSAQPNAGGGFELDAIAAVILGGTSLYGGEGSLAGTLVGCFIIGFISNGMNLLNVSPFYQGMAKGAIILVAVLIDRWISASK
ncbi:MAG: ribose ABC transporter permease [Ardenticatenaceae bacterium]|nr:ribose ABC transporter permease [Ardenticatenaceae bacterium]